jgi:5-methylcytosine-specific restriction endonuclease McrA
MFGPPILHLVLANRVAGRHTGHGCPGGSVSARTREAIDRTRPEREVQVRRVLLLNITYEPLTTVGLHRAVCLVLGEKADVVHADADGVQLHSASTRLDAPSVIRLRRYVRIPHRSRVPLTRAALMRRDNYLCAYCGTKADTIDHVIPRSRGGLHAWENCVASCTRCNHRKADRLIDELGWTLPRDPAAPRGPHWRLIGAINDGDPQWVAYLREPTAA